MRRSVGWAIAAIMMAGGASLRAAEIPWSIDLIVDAIAPLASENERLNPAAVQVMARPRGLYVAQLAAFVTFSQERGSLGEAPLLVSCNLGSMVEHRAEAITLVSCNVPLIWPKLENTLPLLASASVSMAAPTQTVVVNDEIRSLRPDDDCQKVGGPREIGTAPGSEVTVYRKGNSQILRAQDFCISMRAIGVPQVDFTATVSIMMKRGSTEVALLQLKCKPTPPGGALLPGTAIPYAGQSCQPVRDNVTLPKGAKIYARVNADFQFFSGAGALPIFERRPVVDLALDGRANRR